MGMIALYLGVNVVTSRSERCDGIKGVNSCTHPTFLKLCKRFSVV